MTRAPSTHPVTPSARGYGIVYRRGHVTRCPGCSHANWWVGRLMAECGFCGTAVAIGEAA